MHVTCPKVRLVSGRMCNVCACVHNAPNCPHRGSACGCTLRSLNLMSPAGTTTPDSLYLPMRLASCTTCACADSHVAMCTVPLTLPSTSVQLPLVSGGKAVHEILFGAGSQVGLPPAL
jgi:hypothetical protein